MSGECKRTNKNRKGCEQQKKNSPFPRKRESPCLSNCFGARSQKQLESGEIPAFAEMGKGGEWAKAGMGRVSGECKRTSKNRKGCEQQQKNSPFPRKQESPCLSNCFGARSQKQLESGEIPAFAGMGKGREWAKAAMGRVSGECKRTSKNRKGCEQQQQKRTPHSRESGNLPVYLNCFGARSQKQSESGEIPAFAGMGKGGEWAKAGMGRVPGECKRTSKNRKGCEQQKKRTPHSRESGNLPFADAGRATHAPHRF